MKQSKMKQLEKYFQAKEDARSQAIEWSNWSWSHFCDLDYDEKESQAVERLTKLGKRYGLIREFKDMGVI